jgi:DNA-binding response OmpR family regulator
MEAAERLTGKKILVVDDEVDILETVEDLLGVCSVHKALSYEAAVQLLENNSYDAAIFDIMGVKGYELLHLASQKGIPVLMLTAHALNPENLVKSIREGAHSYVPKDKLADIPFFLGEVLENCRKGTQKQSGWFAKLRPFFDKQFGPGWREKDQEFWRDFDSKRVVTKKDRN